MKRHLGVSIAITLLVAASASACGVKGPLEPPPGATNEAAPPDQSNNRPHQPLILDRLLR